MHSDIHGNSSGLQATQMRDWRFGASATEVARLSDYASNFELLEIDLRKPKSLQFALDNPAFAAKVHSVHLLYKPTAAEADGIAISLRGVDDLVQNGIAKKLGIRIFVAHTARPLNSGELCKQLRRLAETAEKYGVTIAVENLADRTNGTHDFMDPRNPRLIAAALEQVGCSHLGLCLDIGHAISNAGLTDSLRWDDNVLKWLKHIHFHDNIFREDLHLPISSTTSEKLIAGFKGLLADSKNDGVAILEHDKFDEAWQSLTFLQSNCYKRIVPAVLG